VITDAIAFVQTNKEKLAAAAFAKEDNNGKESKELDFNEGQIEENQNRKMDGETREQKTTNQVF
jgi:hypothetical protein